MLLAENGAHETDQLLDDGNHVTVGRVESTIGARLRDKGADHLGNQL